MLAQVAITAAVLVPGALAWWVTRKEAPAAAVKPVWGVTQLDPETT